MAANDFGFIEDSQATPATPNNFGFVEDPVAPNQTNPSFLPRLGADALAGLAQFGNGLLNTPHNIANAISPALGAKVPGYLPNYNYGQALGVNTPNIGDKLLQGGIQYAPYLMGGEAALAAKGAESIPLATRIGAQAATGGLFGATQSQNPVSGSLTGAALGAAGEGAPALIKGAGVLGNKLMGAIQPQKQAEQILQTLGGGNSLEGNAQSLAQDIKNAFNQRVAEGQELYKPIFDTLGNEPIIPKNYSNLDKDILNGYDRNLNKMHQQFMDNPTLQNAHNLQSQLGTSIRKLQSSDIKGNLSVADRSTLQGYQEAQTAVRGDINDFLNNTNPELANQYNIATNNWLQNVSPYFDNPKITQIAKGNVTNPNAITSLFKNPEPEVQQIVNDIGSRANSKILYSELGKTQANLTPEKLTNVFNQLDNKGLSSYVTPDIAQQFEQLNNKISARNTARTATGALLGAHFGGSLGAAGGAVLSPLLAKAVQYFPSLKAPLLKSVLSAGASTYKPLTGAITANIINGGQ